MSEKVGIQLRTYLVGLVIILWIVFEDLLLLCVDEGAWKVVSSEVSSPFLAVDEPVIPSLCQLAIDSSHQGTPVRATSANARRNKTAPKTHICLLCWTLNFRALRNRNRFNVSNRSL